MKMADVSKWWQICTNLTQMRGEKNREFELTGSVNGEGVAKLPQSNVLAFSRPFPANFDSSGMAVSMQSSSPMMMSSI
jgi:hypothetical protein